ncbi:MAG TPA: tetratricopeptide repeat protein [Pirellulales bacterium]|nr:tetratricopeptide repeat protein [Pirellulales bacterium]
MNSIDQAAIPRPARIGTPLFTAALFAALLLGSATSRTAAADAPQAKAADQVVVATADGRGSPTKWTGEILDYTGIELRLKLANGHEKTFPTARVLAESTPLGREQQAGDTAFAEGNFRLALGHYRAALEGQHETREWVRRKILSQIVWCYQSLGQWEPACDYFLILLARDRTTQYFDCLPLAWLSEEPSPTLERKAKEWLAQSETPVATLLGASHLLPTAQRTAALAALTRLSTDRDQRIALLAQAQAWRTVAFQATDKQVATWRQLAAKMPEGLRAGPDFVIGSALVGRQPEEAALWYLRVAILCPRQRQLAASGLAAAAAVLDKLDRHEQAQTLWAEITRSYPDQGPVAKEAKERLGDATVRALRAVANEENHEPAEQRFLTGLRRRGLFTLAETYCRERLKDAQLDEVDRAELVIDLVRTLAEHALAVPADSRAPIWQEISATTADFQRHHPQNPRVLLVRMQSALALLARAELTRQEAEIGNASSHSTDEVRAEIRAAIVALKQLDDDLAGEIRRRTRPVEAAAGLLGNAEVASIEANARYQLARGFRNQALAYPADSDDRLNAFSQAIELLGPLSKSPDDDPLAWPSRVEEVSCLRQVGQLAEATRRLAELETSKPPRQYQRRLRAEAIRLLLAKGRLAEALNTAGPAVDDDDAGAADLDFARLEVLVGLWQRAASQGAGGRAADAEGEGAGAKADAQRTPEQWQRLAIEQVQHIEKVHGPYWMRRAETLLASALATNAAQQPAGGAGNLDSAARAAASYWRAGQIDDALTMYDKAARQAAESGQTDKAFELASTAASIQNQRKQFRDAQKRFDQLATALPKHPRAAEAHLAAIYNQAAAAAAEGKQSDEAVLTEYRQMLERHLSTWPQTPSAGQVAWWLGRLYEHEGQWSEAKATFRRVPPEHPQYAAAVEGAARAYQRLLDRARTAGKPDPQTAAEAVEWLRQIIGQSIDKPERAALGRQATLWAARFSISDLPSGAGDAEDLLKQALAGAADAPADWQGAANLLLVSALVERGRYDEAAALLGKVGTGSPDDLLALLERLIVATAQATPAERQKLAQFEQQALLALDAQKSRFDKAGQRRLDVARLRTLVDAGQHKPALALAEKLAVKYPDEGSVQEDYARLLGQSTDPAQMRTALARWREIAERSRAGTPRWFRGQLGMAQMQLALGNRAQARAIVRIVEASYPQFGPADGKPDPDVRAAFLDVLARCGKP